MRGFTKLKKKHLLKILAVHLIGKAEICQDPPTWSQDDQTLSQHKEVKNWRHEGGGVQLEKHADIFYGWPCGLWS